MGRSFFTEDREVNEEELKNLVMYPRGLNPSEPFSTGLLLERFPGKKEA
jgi:hypothetical protein